jgi:hypothetical protein
MVEQEKKNDILNLVNRVPVSGVAISSMFHYHTILQFRNVEGYGMEGNIDFLKSNRNNTSIEISSIKHLKEFLIYNNINCRLHEESL